MLRIMKSSDYLILNQDLKQMSVSDDVRSKLDTQNHERSDYLIRNQDLKQMSVSNGIRLHNKKNISEQI